MNNTPKNPAAVALGRLGGTARRKALSPEQRTAIARTAGLARQAQRKAALDKPTT